MNKIFINIASYENSNNINDEYINMYESLYINHQISTINFYQSDIVISNWKYLTSLNDKWITLDNYSNEKELLKKIGTLKVDSNVVFINTFTESLIVFTNTIKKSLWEKVSLDYNIFTNKNIQRELLLKYNPEITIKYLEIDISSTSLEEITKKIPFPFILKPSSWIQSAWVSRIESREDFETYVEDYKLLQKNLKDKWYNNSTILVEEFIGWEMYSIDYFVDQNGNIKNSMPVKVELANKLWIDDFFNYSRIISTEINRELKNFNLDDFIKQSMLATWIKNTFIHHEFKLTSKWELKTIELNWRIWWFRPWMYSRGYNLNLLSFTSKRNNNSFSVYKNNAVILVYAEKKAVLKWFNTEIWNKIRELRSLVTAKEIETHIWKTVWLTKDWFSKVGIIKIEHSDQKQFQNDYDFIEENYKKLLILS